MPSTDLYVSGFPCQPFSLRRGTPTTLLSEEKALPYFVALDEVRSARHRMILLENVMGLCKRSYNGAPLLDTVLANLKDAASGRYYLSWSLNVSPHTVGEPAHRPRVLFRLVRADCCTCNSLEEFQAEMDRLDSLISERALQLASTLDTVRLCIVRGPPVPSARAEPLHDLVCPCCSPVLQLGQVPFCSRHRAHCGPNKWQILHHARWQLLVQSGWQFSRANTYMALAWARGLPADTVLHTPRERNLVELVFAELCSGGMTDVWDSQAIFDLSQNYGRHALRTDGLLPTVTTSSRLFALPLGRTLTARELLGTYGFPVDVYGPELSCFTEVELLRFVGNCMHPATVGTALAAMLALVASPVCSDDSDCGDDV